MSEDQATPWTIGQEQIETAREAELDHELQRLEDTIDAHKSWLRELKTWRLLKKELRAMTHVSEKTQSAYEVQVTRVKEAKQFLMKLRNDLGPEPKRQLDHAGRVVRGEASEQSYIDAWMPPEPPNMIM